MLVYVDSSALARAYLPDEDGHSAARDLVQGAEHLLVTATWTVVEVTSALVRAARGHRTADPAGVLARLAADTAADGPITLLRVDQDEMARRSVEIVRDHALRSLDALHLAVAELAAIPLLDPGEQLAFAGRDHGQAAAARSLGFVVL